MSFELIEADVSALRVLYPKLRRDFHPGERIPKRFLRRALRRGAYDLFLLGDGAGKTPGYALVNPRSLYGYALLLYIGVDPEVRDRGFGGALLRLLAEQYRDRQGMLAELTHISGEEADLERRRTFYRRAGFLDVPCRYNLFGLDCDLMCLGLSGTAEIRQIAPLVIRDLYGRNMPEKLLERCVKIERA